ncbi:hypothetical protein CRYUN_Cryun30bG0048900 [Craigia yunnanensis]
MPNGCESMVQNDGLFAVFYFRFQLKLAIHVFQGTESSKSVGESRRVRPRETQQPRETSLKISSFNMIISGVNVQLSSSSYYSSSCCIAPTHFSKPKPIQLPLNRTSASLSDMDATSSPGLYPLHRCKTLHLVRHAQGIHNVAGEKDQAAYLSEDLFDAHLTPLGWQQVDNLRKHVQETGLSKKINLVIVSPLLRTMQTAVGVFGGEGYKDGIDLPPLMMENAGESHRPAISSLNCPPFVAVELCREHLGVHPCDRRKSISEYQPFFPAIDFSLANRKR